MSNLPDNRTATVDPFDALFREAEKTDQFWVSKAKLRFTEEMLSRMDDLGLKKADLAMRLGVKPAQISRLCSGLNNFTVETMVRVARALNCEFNTHLHPEGATTHWIDLLKGESAQTAVWDHQSQQYPSIAGEQKVIHYAPQEVVSEHTVPYVCIAS